MEETMEGPLHVLIVEDDEDHSKLIEISLLRYNSSFKVDTAQTGAACLKLVGSRPYAAIVLDILLPDQSGLEVLDKLARMNHETPVVVVSGHGNEQIAVDALKKGAYDYLVKDSNYINVLPNVLKKTIEKFHLEMKLKEAERLYQNIFENANDLILNVAPESLSVTDVNNKSSEMLRYEKDQLTAMVFTDLFRELDRQEAKALLQRTVAAGAYRNDNLAMVTAAGLEVPVAINASAIRVNKRAYVLCNIRDMAEQKQLQSMILESKKRLQNTFDGIQDIIYQVNRNMEIVIANKSFAGVCNNSSDNIIGRKCYDVMPYCSEPCSECPVRATFDSGQPQFLERHRQERVFEMSTYPIHTVDSNLEAVAVYARDVTERKRLETTLVQSEKLSTIGLLASGIAHEIRNPLNVIETARYYIDEFMAEKDEDIKEKLGIIRKNVQRASNIINNLLEFSRHSPMQQEVVDLRKVIDSTISLLGKELDAKNIEYRRDIATGCIALLSQDSIKQVILNIIMNAMQAMPEGGRLSIRAENAQDAVRVDISDTGVGIPRKNIPHIFTPFFTTKEVGVGTGLGLYITHMIVEREGGRIDVESEEGKGTTFTLTLPHP
jgi:PAS domain S-box-containing protein